MSEKLTSLAQLRMTAEKSKELSAQIAAAVAEAIEELKSNTISAIETNKQCVFSNGYPWSDKLTLRGDSISFVGEDSIKIYLEPARLTSTEYTLNVMCGVGDSSLVAACTVFASKNTAEGKIRSASLLVNGTPTSLNQVVNKQYVDNAVAAAAGMPSGVIVMWSGAQNNIPAGWVLCNGQNGTPDLRNRFVLGAGDKYTVGTKGGEETHKLSVSEMPQHNHLVSDKIAYGYTSDPAYETITSERVYTETSAFEDGPDYRFSGYAGASMPHNNMPPYYALCYIMKT